MTIGLPLVPEKSARVIVLASREECLVSILPDIPESDTTRALHGFAAYAPRVASVGVVALCMSFLPIGEAQFLSGGVAYLCGLWLVSLGYINAAHRWPIPSLPMLAITLVVLLSMVFVGATTFPPPDLERLGIIVDVVWWSVFGTIGFVVLAAILGWCACWKEQRTSSGTRLLIVAALLSIGVAISGRRYPDTDPPDFADPLLRAARAGNVDVIEDLLHSGRDPNVEDAYGNTPLSVAAKFGQIQAMEVLMKSGAMVDGTGGATTPLLNAIRGGHREAIRRLLKSQASPGLADDDGTTPVGLAAIHGDAETIELLASFGADVEQPDNLGWHPLHLALRSSLPTNSDRLTTVKVLLDHGADPNANNVGGYLKDSDFDSSVGFRLAQLPNRGDTPVAIAHGNGFQEIVDLLRQHGGM